MGFEAWDWDLATGTGKKVAYNGNGKDVLLKKQNLQTI